jgi:colicin import membrane protein
MVNGIAKKIPNYKTLEVMLAERNQTLLSVRVLEENQCADIPKDNQPIPNKSGAWKKEYADITSIEAFKKLENNAKSAGALVEEAKGQAESQIGAVKAQAAADKAAAEAAKAEAEAAKLLSQQAIAEAEAALANAAALQAEAEAKKAEYEALIENEGS